MGELHLFEGEHLADQQVRVVSDVDAFCDALFEQVANSAGTDAHEHLDKFRSTR